MAFMEDFQHLNIELEAIKLATDNFSDQKFIGGGGFGKVYKGEVSHSKGRSMAAFKCLDRKHGQGEAEFLKEINTLFHYKHENLISLLGFCEDDGERILVYEYASKGSLDQHLDSRVLDWRQRVKICLEAAKALEYLHDPKGTHQRVLHCDIKSANILLDDNWIAKLSDLGLSKMGPANQQDTFLISNAAGTFMYCDPLYLETGLLSKESDVYSFGVVLFEVLYGRVCYEKIERRGVQILVPTWRQNYEEMKTVGLHISQDMDPTSLKVYSDIPYRCLKRSHEDRPKMALVVIELDTALKVQEISEGKVQLDDYEEMVRGAEPPLNYGSKAELMISLSKQGILLNAVVFGEVLVISSFGYSIIGEIKAEVVSPQTTYASYLVYKLPEEEEEDLSNCEGPTWVMEKDLVLDEWKEDDFWYMYFLYPRTPVIRRNVDDNFHNPVNRLNLKGVGLPKQRNDGWMEVQIWQFQTGTNTKMIPMCLKLRRIYVPTFRGLVIQGVEFRPI